MPKPTSENRKKRNLLFSGHLTPEPDTTFTATTERPQRMAVRFDTSSDQSKVVELYDDILRNINSAKELLANLGFSEAQLNEMLNKYDESNDNIVEINKQLSRTARKLNQQQLRVALILAVCFFIVIAAQILLLALNLPIGIGITAHQEMTFIIFQLANFVLFAGISLMTFLFTCNERKKMRATLQSNRALDEDKFDPNNSSIESWYRKLINYEQRLNHIDRDAILNGTDDPKQHIKYLTALNLLIIIHMEIFSSVAERHVLLNQLAECLDDTQELRHMLAKLHIEQLYVTNDIDRAIVIALGLYFTVSAICLTLEFVWTMLTVTGSLSSQFPFITVAYIAVHTAFAIFSFFAYKYINSLPDPTPTNNTQNIGASDPQTALEYANNESEDSEEIDSEEMDSGDHEDTDFEPALSM